MKNRMITKEQKRTVTVILSLMMSLMMVAGVFTGMNLDVKAARTIRYEDLQVGTIVHTGDIVTVSASIVPNSEGNELSLICNRPEGGETGYASWRATNTDGAALSVTVGSVTYDGKIYTAFKLEQKSEMYHCAWFDICDGNEEADDSVAKDNTGIENGHVCQFEWITTLEPTTGADGLEEYKCVGCGLVQESHTISASVAAVTGFYENVKEAPENGSITYDSGKLHTISDYLLKKMAERSDVTVTVNFEYQNAKYEITFPAGTDYTSVLTDEDNMYGYFGVAAKLGLPVVAK